MPTSDAIKLRHKRVRKRVVGSPQRPRLCVHFSGQHIYAQIIDDSEGKQSTLALLDRSLKIGVMLLRKGEL